MMKVISFLNMKGGVGKTTSSVNVATGLAMGGKKVLLVDLDPQANTTDIFLRDNVELAIDCLMLDQTLTEKSIVKVDENLDLIPSSLDLASVELKLKLSNLPQHNCLQRVLEQVREKYDYCIIDCPPILNILTVNALFVTDELIIPIKPDKFALTGFETTEKNYISIKNAFALKSRLKILFTIANRNNTEKEIIEKLKSSEYEVFETVIRNQPKPIVDAGLGGRAVIKENPDKVPVANDYRLFVSEILKEEN